MSPPNSFRANFARLPFLGRANFLALGALTLVLILLLGPEWLHNPDLSHGLFMPAVFVFLLYESRSGRPGRYLPAGPWVAEVLNTIVHDNAAASVRLVKGSHIVVPRLYDGDQAYTFQIGDGRVVFVIPYEGLYSLIGTTDLDFEGDPARPMATEAEIAYLCGAVDGYFKRGPRPAEVVWSFAGVRPLIDDGKADVSAVSRDYTLDLDAPVGQAPALTVYGGKITTFRRLAEEALSRLLPLLGRQHAAWTAGAHLPGGDIADADFGRFLTECGRRFAFVPADMLARMAHAYGTRLDLILADKHRLGELGRRFGDLLSEAELDYLCREEWARNAEDVLWRRSKLGLHLRVAAQSEVAAWFGAR